MASGVALFNRFSVASKVLQLQQKVLDMHTPCITSAQFSRPFRSPQHDLCVHVNQPHLHIPPHNRIYWMTMDTVALQPVVHFPSRDLPHGKWCFTIQQISFSHQKLWIKGAAIATEGA